MSKEYFVDFYSLFQNAISVVNISYSYYNYSRYIKVFFGINFSFKNKIKVSVVSRSCTLGRSYNREYW